MGLSSSKPPDLPDEQPPLGEQRWAEIANHLFVPLEQPRQGDAPDQRSDDERHLTHDNEDYRQDQHQERDDPADGDGGHSNLHHKLPSHVSRRGNKMMTTASTTIPPTTSRPMLSRRASQRSPSVSGRR